MLAPGKVDTVDHVPDTEGNGQENRASQGPPWVPSCNGTEMRVHSLRSSVWLPQPLARVFDFFSEARNLEELTPPWLRFQVLTPEPIEMRAGLKIDYRLRLRGIPLRWQSEITKWDPPRLFVDEQVRGPYRLWVHEHRFEERDGGTLAEDYVRYAVLGGWIADRIAVRRDIARIFDYRRDRLGQIFGTDDSSRTPVAVQVSI